MEGLLYNFSMPKITLDHVTVAYHLNRNEDFLALDGASTVFENKAFNVLIGPSGSGKTTLLRAVSGLADYEGKIYFDTQNMADIPPQKRELAYVSQGIKLYPSMTIFENIAFPLRVMKLPREEVINKVYSLAKAFDISDCLTRKPRHLSEGQKQRVAMARALIKDPKILLLDEPTDGLDPNQKDYMRRLIKEMSQNKTIIISTHLLEEAETVCNRIIVLDKGVIRADGDLKQILKQTGCKNLSESFRVLTKQEA